MKYHEMIYGMAVVVYFLGESDDKPINPAILMDLVDIRFLRQPVGRRKSEGQEKI